MLTTLAVTGTNGKTSTAEFCRQLFSGAGVEAASYGTLGLVGSTGRDPDPPMALGPGALPAFLTRLEADDVDAVAMEAYSSSLRGGIFEHVSVDVAAFTNLARDHLDVHGDMASYFRAKQSLFTAVLREDGTAVVNLDDDRGPALVAGCRERGVDVTTYGFRDDADVAVRATTPTADGVAADLSVRGARVRVEFGFVGDVMVSNACCALAAVLAAGVPMNEALDGLSALRAPPGRLELLGVRDGVEVFVDYAHTPAALQAALETLRPRAAGDLVVVFGCGGDRDRGKRRRMGAVAAEYAASVVVTDDNPRFEDPASIRAAVLDGCPTARECGDRATAIATAVESARDGDVVVVAGKGHERTQEVGGDRRVFSDHDVVRRLLG